MAAISRDQILARVRRYADHRNADQGLLDTDLVDMINDSLADYYDLLVSVRGHEYFINTNDVALAAGQAAYDLPTDFYQLSTATLAWSSTEHEALIPLSSNRDIADFTTQQLSWERFTRKGYRIYGNGSPSPKTIEIFPTPTSSVTLLLRYVPEFSPLTLGTSEIDAENGWAKLVCLDVAAEFRGILGLPADFLIQRRDEQRQRVLEMATERLQDDPAEVVDTERNGPHWYPFPRWNSA